MIADLCLKTENNLTETITLRQETLAKQLAIVHSAIQQMESEIVQTIELNHDVLAILHSLTMKEARPSTAIIKLKTLLKKSKSDWKESVSQLLEAKNLTNEWTNIDQLVTETTWKHHSNGKKYRVKLATDTHSSSPESIILLNYALHRLKMENLWEEVTKDESSDDDEGNKSFIG